ncbi:MAG TPA: hypothetical protein VI894_02765 [Candidatus Nanoarchaeia archaeon]|nr:hypothetical protein [Candidatus Nanoarchaeia archaeon]
MKTKIDKKAFMKVIEVGIAIVLTYLFLILITPKQVPASSRQQVSESLSVLQQSVEFRNCVITEDSRCINESISRFLRASFDFRYSISDNPNYALQELPQKIIFVDSIFISGSTTNYKPRIFKVYYWTR